MLGGGLLLGGFVTCIGISQVFARSEQPDPFMRPLQLGPSRETQKTAHCTAATEKCESL